MYKLKPFEQDALGELLNMAMGMAASKLSEITEHEIALTVPQVDLMSKDEYKKLINKDNDGELISISEHFSGSFSGEMILMFMAGKSMDLIRTILGDNDYDDEFTDMEEEVLSEVGNILLNSCIGVIADTLNKEFQTELPEFNKGSIEKVLPDIFHSGDNTELILLAHIEFSIEDKEIKGQLALSLSMQALRNLIDQLNAACNIAV